MIDWPDRVRDWKGKVKSRFAIANSLCEMPAGTIFTIRDSGYNLYLTTEPCKECGMKMFITIKGVKEHKKSLFEYLGKDEVEDEQAKRQ